MVPLPAGAPRPTQRAMRTARGRRPRVRGQCSSRRASPPAICGTKPTDALAGIYTQRGVRGLWHGTGVAPVSRPSPRWPGCQSPPKRLIGRGWPERGAACGVVWLAVQAASGAPDGRRLREGGARAMPEPCPSHARAMPEPSRLRHSSPHRSPVPPRRAELAQTPRARRCPGRSRSGCPRRSAALPAPG